MGAVPDHEIAALRALSGYDQMLEIDRLCRTYGTDEASIRTAMAAVASTPDPVTSPAYAASTNEAGWDTSHKSVPGIDASTPSAAPTMVDRGQFRFEYDPTREAAQRREQVSQAILCPACGVALGIPDVRPIKVTCPSCLMETTFTH